MKRFLGVLLAIFIASLFLPGSVLAIDCNLGAQGFNQSNGSLQVCIGGFSTVEELHSTTFKFHCVIEGDTGICASPDQTGSLSVATPASNNGTYYGCIAFNVRSDWNKADVNFFNSSGQQICSIPSVALNAPGTTNTGESIQGHCATGNIDTAIGCIPITDQNALIGFFLRWGIGIGGGVAFLLIIVAGIQIMTSRGDPNRLKAGQELMTSAIAGLLLLIFSVIILRIIGFDILNIAAFK